MRIFKSDTSLGWGELDLPLFGLETDWFGKKQSSAMGFSLAVDGESLWFLATGNTPASVHPEAVPGRFTPELWKHDVAEFFLSDPVSGKYLEFNLAANGAWWACAFSGPRVTAYPQPDFETVVRTHHDPDAPSGWLAALVIPIQFLEREIAYGKATTANVTFIRDSPSQVFLSAAKLPGNEPDFHQPSDFPAVATIEIPAL